MLSKNGIIFGTGGDYENIITVAKSGGQYSGIQDAIDAANPIVHSGTAQAGTVNEITLATAASSVNNFYTGMRIRITGGAGSGQMRTIIAYQGASRVCGIAPDWDVTPVAGSAYAIKSPIIVSVGPGEYKEQIILKDCVDIIAMSPKTQITAEITDGNSNCYCNLVMDILANLATGYAGLSVSAAYSEISLCGSIYNRNGGSALLVNDGTVLIEGDLHGDDIGSLMFGAIDVEGGITTIRNGIISSLLINTISIANGTLNIENCTINALSSTLGNSSGVDIWGGTVSIRDTVINSLTNDANSHGIKKSGGTLKLQNVKIVCTHASANSIYAATAQDVVGMGVWANRDDHANITQLITGGFTYDADVV